MKLIKAFFFCALIAGMFSSCKDVVRNNVINKTASAPLIDGEMDSVWNKGTWMDIKNIRWTRIKEVQPADISASFKMLWDSANCYFFVKVRDNVKFCSTYSTEFERVYDLKLKDLDGVDLFFESQNNKETALNSKTFSNKKFTYHSDSICSSGATPENAILKGIDFAQRDTKDGYIMEIKYPWKDLGIIPANNKEIGLEVNVVDNDNYVPSPGILPKKATMLSWNDITGRNPNVRTDIYGTIILKEN